MMNDSVRAELLSKVSISKPLKIEMKENSLSSGKLTLQNTSVEDVPKQHQTQSAALIKPVAPKPLTSEIAINPTTPTLVEFHSKNSIVPEWRLHLQNAVRQRHNREKPPQPEKLDLLALTTTPHKTKLVANAATTLKVETVEVKKHLSQKNPTLNSALERIEKARQKFLVEEEFTPVVAPIVSARPASKNFPFYIAAKQVEVAHDNVKPKKSIEVAKPKLATSFQNGSEDLDTNKLPLLRHEPAKVSTSYAKPIESTLKIEILKTDSPKIEIPKVETSKTEIKKVDIKIEEKNKIDAKPVEIEEFDAAQENHEEFEDSAPFAMRFNAGLFDLIIGSFLSLFLLTPFILMGGSWLTFTGVLAYLATCSVVMFIYLTTTIGFYGRTFGMRLFSLEVIDIGGENYPTLHQAAVSSAVYILTLAFGGIGFLALFFNGERRAIHDLVSGTIVVKEN